MVSGNILTTENVFVGMKKNDGKSKRTRVVVELERHLHVGSVETWGRLIDWGAHGEWIPATYVEVDDKDPDSFVAYSGYKPLVLEDRMRVVSLEFDGQTGTGVVEKLGPVLLGSATFTVTPGATPDTCTVTWSEDVTVPHLPKLLAAPVGWVAKHMFNLSLKRLGNL